MRHEPIVAAGAAPRTRPSNYPEPFAAMMAGRTKRPIGEVFGLSNFGVNLTTLAPGSVSALQHVHSVQDEMIYVISGAPTLVLDGRRIRLAAGMVMGFAAGGPAHHLQNDTPADCVILEIGDRSAGDRVSYPADDIQAVLDESGRWHFAHKDGTPY